ncbi:Hypothetical_protein [Hexamita inflata]|uniref:Hypothetical_protein n=1 Tax=Hexamita inflata TaxID=28002 RepID=A0AA86PKH3_9EUKA|nr:Hypothetical protein HINF_LOCUS27746 [Hexamita inflata]
MSNSDSYEYYYSDDTDQQFNDLSSQKPLNDQKQESAYNSSIFSIEKPKQLQCDSCDKLKQLPDAIIVEKPNRIEYSQILYLNDPEIYKQINQYKQHMLDYESAIEQLKNKIKDQETNNNSLLYLQQQLKQENSQQQQELLDLHNRYNILQEDQEKQRSKDSPQIKNDQILQKEEYNRVVNQNKHLIDENMQLKQQINKMQLQTYEQQNSGQENKYSSNNKVSKIQDKVSLSVNTQNSEISDINDSKDDSVTVSKQQLNSTQTPKNRVSSSPLLKDYNSCNIRFVTPKAKQPDVNQSFNSQQLKSKEQQESQNEKSQPQTPNSKWKLVQQLEKEIQTEMCALLIPEVCKIESHIEYALLHKQHSDLTENNKTLQQKIINQQQTIDNSYEENCKHKQFQQELQQKLQIQKLLLESSEITLKNKQKEWNEKELSNKYKLDKAQLKIDNLESEIQEFQKEQNLVKKHHKQSNQTNSQNTTPYDFTQNGPSVFEQQVKHEDISQQQNKVNAESTTNQTTIQQRVKTNQNTLTQIEKQNEALKLRIKLLETDIMNKYQKTQHDIVNENTKQNNQQQDTLKTKENNSTEQHGNNTQQLDRNANKAIMLQQKQQKCKTNSKETQTDLPALYNTTSNQLSTIQKQFQEINQQAPACTCKSCDPTIFPSKLEPKPSNQTPNSQHKRKKSTSSYAQNNISTTTSISTQTTLSTPQLADSQIQTDAMNVNLKIQQLESRVQSLLHQLFQTRQNNTDLQSGQQFLQEQMKSFVRPSMSYEPLRITKNGKELTQTQILVDHQEKELLKSKGEIQRLQKVVKLRGIGM